MADSQTLESIKQLQQDVQNLESRNAFQDDVIEQLNNEITVHQQQLSEIKEQLKLMAARIKENQFASQDGKVEIEPPPPHY